jgi:hypothetical protein
VTNAWSHFALSRRRTRLALIGIAVGLAVVFAVTTELLRAADPLKVAGLPVT